MSVRALFGKVNRYAGLLEEIEDPHGIGYSDLQTVLVPLEDALGAISRRFESLGVPDDEDEIERVQSIVDDEVGYIDELLGAAFTISQRYLTHAVSNTKRLHDLLREASLPGFACIADSKKATILRTASPLVGSSRYTEVEVINAVANFYKHRDEWPHLDWIKMTGQEKLTVDVLLGVGIPERSTGQFRSAAEVLGETKYTSLSFLLQKLCSWRTDLAKLHRDELRTRQLVT